MPAGRTSCGRTTRTRCSAWRSGKSPLASYRIYRHTRPITAASLGEAQLLDEVGQFSCCDEREVKTEWKGEQIKNVKLDDARVPRTAVQPGKELPVGVGVYVKTTSQDGDYYYAVVSAVNGVENTLHFDAGNATLQPVHEKVVPHRARLLQPDADAIPEGAHAGVLRVVAR